MVNNGGNIAKLADELSDERHAALITSDISRRYFCGFTSSAGTKQRNVSAIAR